MSDSDFEPGFIPLEHYNVEEDEMLRRAKSFYSQMNSRRTTRHFSNKEVPRELIELAIRTASTAPSGAHLQPWTFVAISNSKMKARVRKAAEEEEARFYHERVPDEWREVLAPLGTDHVKSHITDAPWVVVLFRQTKRERRGGGMAPTYYSQESCGIAAGLFISSVHNMGLATLPHTPSPMGFLGELLGRPDYERAMLLLPVGYPAEDARVPDLERKRLEEVSQFWD
tara:strand:- start:873 stop:1553 length:681 start_codon:yes stop_codon:yes gene_type:complete